MKRALVVSAALAVAGLLLISESASAGMYGFDGGGFRGGFVGAGFRPAFGVGPRWGYRPWYGIGRGYGYGLGFGLAAGGAALAVRYPYNGWYPYEGYGLAGYPDATATAWPMAAVIEDWLGSRPSIMACSKPG